LRKIALWHMSINLTVVALYGFNFYTRLPDPEPQTHQIMLSGVAILMLLASGWLGGRMVFEHGVGVNNAP
jgi:uncharacterized membrane protein